MKVKELIEKLQQFDLEMNVILGSSENWEEIASVDFLKDYRYFDDKTCTVKSGVVGIQ